MRNISMILLVLHASQVIAQTDGFTMNVDRSKTYYRIFGIGDPILIINGGPGMNSNGFEDLARRLSAHNKVILYDQRGTGKSVLGTVSDKTVNMNIMIDDIESLRNHLKIDKWVVLGHSFGGMLGSYYAAKHPAAISKLILSSSGGIDLSLLQYVGDSLDSKLTQIERDSLRYFNTLTARGDTTYKVRLGRGKMLAPAYVYHKKFVPQLAKRLTQGNSEINQIVWNCLRKMNFNCAPMLKNFSPPVLIIQGKQDIISAETAETARRAFNNSKVVLMDNCGHYGWLDAPEVYFSEIADFLQ